MKKLRITVGEDESLLELDGETYKLRGAIEARGAASIARIQDGVFSVLLDRKSSTVRVVPVRGGYEVLAGSVSRLIEIADLRDRSSKTNKQSLAGPYELRALMPGKVIKLLVAEGERVEAGQALIVVEAMKMQNETKSPKAGVVTKIFAQEGATVAAGERLLLVE